MKENLTYLKDYFYQIKFVPTPIFVIFILYIWIFDKIHSSLFLGVPLLVTLITSQIHHLDLPPILFYLPLTKEERLQYLRKMIELKILLPLIFTAVWDIVLYLIHPLDIFVLVLQVLGVLICCYFHAELYSYKLFFVQNFYHSKETITAMIILSVTLYEIAMFGICVSCNGHLSTPLFITLMTVTILFFLPCVVWTRKHRNQIHDMFVSFEQSSGKEEA